MVAHATLLILLPCLGRIACVQVCPRDFYYSTDTDRCESCAELCHQATVRKTESTCRRLCPVGDTEVTKTSLTLKKALHGNNTPSVNKLNSTEERLPHTLDDSQVTIYTVCTLMLLIMIMCCVSAVLLMSGRYPSCCCCKRRALCLKYRRTGSGEFEEVNAQKQHDGGTLIMQIPLGN
ncbi:uncharacterized protein LOC124259299 [Haliotis rubra]|uniref:uncharacterized protein LOC124259299 n=1 Tax=Haliotis rubra TaxID=36100 RepID=UPI001EE5815E|nr:uncharacterized protein LOC124259299 [Haliotis rubra]